MSETSIDERALAHARARRLRETMARLGVPALLTSDPIDILYACGARNMTVFSLMGPFRFVLVFAEGPTILWEFAGCEHLVGDTTAVDEVRVAPGVNALAGAHYGRAAAAFADEVAAACRRHGADGRLAVEGFDPPVTDALRAAGLTLGDATAIFVEARRIKQAPELEAMREAVRRVEAAAADLEAGIAPGASEVEVWALFHRHLIATQGEFVSTRLFQSGPRTFPYFQEAGARRMCAGDLVCFDTDALGYLGYAVDFSRTFLCGDEPASPVQKAFYRRAHEQLQHNAALLGPGVAYEDFARRAWPVPAEHRGHGYYCLAHGLGLCGEYPYVPHAFEGVPYTFEGAFEPGMVVCVESYIGAAAEAEGVKLEDQFLITPSGVERLTTYPFCGRLLG
ncbi:M24 family metallopeptidase [Salinarimonas ramus]|uniref:Peptidase M24 n=1 Tax=Salinarimonas ramus TaxID=690164 RepID=A0A917QFP2_9HYPH|nr:M24 family metallopeptidase [Salinarimonas ramus]GGK46776.1 peptidase M24 [Salinarimonas ramus]